MSFGLANTLIPSGFFMVLLGVAQGFSLIEKYLSGHPQMQATWTASVTAKASGNPWEREQKVEQPKH